MPVDGIASVSKACRFHRVERSSPTHEYWSLKDVWPGPILRLTDRENHMRRFAIAAASVVVLLILALLAAAQFVNVDRFRPKIQSELETKLKRKVQIGSIRLGVFPPGVRLNDVEIGESPAVPS